MTSLPERDQVMTMVADAVKAGARQERCPLGCTPLRSGRISDEAKTPCRSARSPVAKVVHAAA